MDVLLASMAAKTDRMAETLAFRVPRSWYEFSAGIAKDKRRDLADVERALYERGMAAYKRDGLLFEPEDTPTIEADHDSAPLMSVPRGKGNGHNQKRA